MPEKIALKLLQHSDITLFRPYYERHMLSDQRRSKQKAINLNADIFIDLFYPTIKSGSARVYRVDLRIFGPGLSGEYSLQRKVLKEQKNWRLDGELVDNPTDEPERFNDIAPGDLAVITFDGVIPDVIGLYLLSTSSEYDAALHQVLSKSIGSGRKSMVEIDLPFIQQTIQDVHPNEQHPLRDLLLEDVLVDAAQNGINGIRKLTRRASKRRITAEVLQQARENASQTGRTGEEVLNAYFGQQKQLGKIKDFEWVSNANAISPFDFTVWEEGAVINVEAKTTSGSFENTLHISFNELLQMREAEHYHLYRVYEVTDTASYLKIARNMKQFAEEILAVLDKLPSGVRPDSISVDPRVLTFEPPVHIEVPNEDEV